MKYYIIKDVVSGLYYRGKGQNKWGKYFNQASIFRNLQTASNSCDGENRRFNFLKQEGKCVVIEIDIKELNVVYE